MPRWSLRIDGHKFLLVQFRVGHMATQRYDRGSPLKTSVRCLSLYNYLKNNLKKMKVHFDNNSVKLFTISLCRGKKWRDIVKRS